MIKIIFTVIFTKEARFYTIYTTFSAAYASVIDGNNTISLVKGKISNNELKNTTVLDSAEYTDADVIEILGTLTNFGQISKIRIDYNAETGGIYVYLNGKSKPVLSVQDDSHKNKMGRFGIWLWYQAGQTLIDNLKIEPSLPGFAVCVPEVTVDTEANTVAGIAKITNTDLTATDAVVILAVYDAENKLDKIAITPVSVDALCRYLEVKAECAWTDGYTAKCFVFDSLDAVTPLTECAAYPAA